LGFALIFQLLAWLFFGLGSFIVIQTVHPLTNNLLMFSIPVAAWIIGYLSLITPMGLGVREVVFITLLMPYMNIADATVITVFSRINMVIVETINV